MKCKTYEEWLEYYENVTKEQIIEDVKHDNDHILELNHLASERKEEIDKLNKEYERIYNENCRLRELHSITDISLLDEIYRLNNIINELEEHFKMLKLNAPNESKEFFEDIIFYIRKLKKIKGE